MSGGSFNAGAESHRGLADSGVNNETEVAAVYFTSCESKNKNSFGPPRNMHSQNANSNQNNAGTAVCMKS